MKNMNISLLVRSILVCALLLGAGTALAGPILIAHKDVSVDAVTAGDLNKMLLGKSANWPDGSRVVLSMLKDGPIADEFLKTYAKKSPKQFGTFWKKAVFSGTGEMPAAFDTEADLVVFVSRTPGAIGFIDEATAHDEVKVIGIN